MQGHTKTRHIEEARFTGKPAAIARLRKLANELGAQEVNDNISAADIFPDLATNRPGVALRGIRSREGLTQVQLAEKVGIPQRHISEMENGKRPIGKATAHKLAEVLGTDYRLFL